MDQKANFSARAQGVGAAAAMMLFRALPVDAASWLGGFLARKLGPLSGAHKTAVRNLALAFPEKSGAERAAIAVGMWDNIGRTVAEYPHLGALLEDERRVEVVDVGGIVGRLREDGKGAVLISLHAGNWELCPVPGHRGGLKQHHFYRAPNNPFVDRMLCGLRAGLRQEGYLAKGVEGGRQAAMLLKKGAHIGMMLDQKQDEGIAALFFGREAMTTTAPAALARRLGVPIGGGRVVRLKGCRFRVVVDEVVVTRTEDREADVARTTREMTALLEGWIRERPEQWFWLHRRWGRG